jgi:hypothetical protein
MNNNYDKIIWMILFFVFLIIIGLYISEFTPLGLDQKKKALDQDIIREDFTNSSNTNEQLEGAAHLYKWGLPDDNDNSINNSNNSTNNNSNNSSNNNNSNNSSNNNNSNNSTNNNNSNNSSNNNNSNNSSNNNNSNNRSNNNNNSNNQSNNNNCTNSNGNWWNTWWTNLESGISSSIIGSNNTSLSSGNSCNNSSSSENSGNNTSTLPNDNCSNYDITKNKDIDKYVLKSSVPPCQDMSEFVTKNMMNANPDLSDYILKSEVKPCEESKIDISKYILKSDVPACPTCPICPECPICPVCPTSNVKEENQGNKVYNYNITDHPDISKYISIDEVNKKYIKKEECVANKNNTNANANAKSDNIKFNVTTKSSFRDDMPSVEKERAKILETDHPNNILYNKFAGKILSEDFNENDFKILNGDGYYAGDNLYATVK